MSHSSASSAGGAASLRWVVPLAIGVIGVLYQVIVGQVLQEGGGRLEHAIDMILFGIVIPALVFWAWTVITRARQAEHLLAAINIASQDAFVRLDPEGRIRFWSRQAEI